MILGFTGTNGAGKGTVVNYLVEKKGFAHYSARGFLLEELALRGVSDDRSALRDIGNELRRMHGPAFVVEQLFQRAEEGGVDAIIESLRSTGEAEFLKGQGAKIGAVDAERKLRYERAVLRGHTTDKVSFEDFCIQEDREMASIEPWDMNIFGVMTMADFTLENNGTLDELHAQIDSLPLFK
jgi:dephospho-CoA kinase